MKVYIDTSVFGGFFDMEFETATKQLFKEIDKGQKFATVSNLVISELSGSPEKVRNLFNIYRNKIELVTVQDEMYALANDYIRNKALPAKCLSDALHVATATILKIDVIVSWNFKHIVNLNRIRVFNGINIKNGYNFIEIRTPKEVLLP